MSNTIADASQRNIVRTAGFMFLFAFIVPSLNWTLVLSSFLVADDMAATAKNITANEFLFRVGIAVELTMAVGLIILAASLYRLLKQVNKNLALLALSLKLVEAAMSAAIVLITLIALLFLTGEAYLTAFTPEQLQAPIGFLLNIHTVLYSVPMVILGIDMMIFSYLFLKSKYIPGMLAWFGIVSFALIFIHAVMSIIAPEYAAMPINQMIFWAPSGLFEIVIGTWLLVKGIKA